MEKTEAARLRRQLRVYKNAVDAVRHWNAVRATVESTGKSAGHSAMASALHDARSKYIAAMQEVDKLEGRR